jgi:hypothetical protein
MSHCDLCGTESGKLSVVDDLWGLGASAICEDAAACSGVWAPAFDAGETGEPHEGDLTPEPEGSPNDTAVLHYAPTFDSLDKADPPTRMGGVTRRLARA